MTTPMQPVTTGSVPTPLKQGVPAKPLGKRKAKPAGKAGKAKG